MILKSIEIKNFRNLKNVNLTFNPKVNIIYGKNAQGKTNLLEAIWLLSGNKSFRGATDREMSAFNEDSFFIGGAFEHNGEESVLKIGTSVLGNKAQKKVYKNGKTFSTSRALLGQAQMTVFSPDDLSLIKDGPAGRRNYCDIILASLFPSYAKTLNRYNRIVMQKNALLRDEAPYEQIEIWSQQLSLFGASVIKSRCELIKRLLPFAQKSFFDMAGKTERFWLEYQSTVCEDCEISESELAERFYDKLKENFYKESAAQSCLYGPHRDEIVIKINDRDARQFASQGQQRSAVLALLLSKTELIREQTGKAPLVLLDDVMSELDEGRQKYLLEKIEDFQVFITCCQDELFKKSDKQTFYVENGQIEKKE